MGIICAIQLPLTVYADPESRLAMRTKCRERCDLKSRLRPIPLFFSVFSASKRPLGQGLRGHVQAGARDLCQIAASTAG